MREAESKPSSDTERGRPPWWGQGPWWPGAWSDLKHSDPAALKSVFSGTGTAARGVSAALRACRLSMELHQRETRHKVVTEGSWTYALLASGRTEGSKTTSPTMELVVATENLVSFSRKCQSYCLTGKPAAGIQTGWEAVMMVSSWVISHFYLEENNDHPPKFLSRLCWHFVLVLVNKWDYCFLSPFLTLL